MAPRMALFNKRSRLRSHKRTMSRSSSDGMDPVEVSVPSLHEHGHHSHHGHHGNHSTRARRIRILPNGQCTTMNEDGVETSRGPDRSVPKVLEEEQRTSSGRQILGTFTGTLEDFISDAFLWLMRQSKGKRINASKDVLSMYHDLFLYGEVPLTIKVRTALRGWPLRTYLIWIEFFAAIISVVLYIITTYQTGPRKEWQRIVELVCGLFFVVDYVLNVYSAPVRLYYIFSYTGLIDFVSTLPIALYWSPQKDNGAAILLFFRVLRIIPVINQVGGLTGGAIKEQIFTLVMYTFGVVFIAAGVLQYVDNKATSESVKSAKGCPTQGCLTFFDAFWFMVVTISTVGYGDITPTSNWGRAIVLCVIIGALVILPPQINRILRLASRRPYGGSFAVRKVVGSRFIIVSGNLSFRTVQDFLAEFYHPTHDKDMNAFPLRVVIMAPYKPSFELKTLLVHYKSKVEFIQGSPVKDSDLDRVSAKVASAFYLLADQQARDPESEDAAQIVRTLSVHRYCGSRVRIIVELLKPEKSASAIWDETEQGIEIICLDSIRFKLLARSCHIKGLSTFLVNLFRSGIDISKPLKGHWMMKYLHGLHMEVFPVILPEVFHRDGLTFDQAAELVYRRFHVILFGIDIAHEEHGEESREVLLYPKGRYIRSSDVGLVIARDLRTAELISKFDFGLHPHCLGLRKFYCAACLKTGLRQKSTHKEDRDLLERVKKSKSLGMEREALNFSHEHKISMLAFEAEVKEIRDDITVEPEALEEYGSASPSTLRKTHSAGDVSLTRHPSLGDLGISRHHGLTSHASMLHLGDKDSSVHGGHRKLELISQASMQRKADDNDSEISSVRASKHSVHEEGDEEEEEEEEVHTVVENHSHEKSENMHETPHKTPPKRLTISLEDAINMAMSWPPVQQFDKPDPAILERRAPEILENLQRRSMNVVKLHLPHILLCMQGQWPTSLFYFISHLRTPGLPMPPIVILHPYIPSSADWGCVGLFDHVYYVKGSPSYELDLVRAGILQAEKVVILTQGTSIDTGEIANDEDRLTPSVTFTLDVNNVFIAATVERLLRPSKERVIVELQQETEIQYLQPRLLFDRRIFDSEMYQRNRSATFQFAPPYIDGKAFCPAALGFLMYATFYNCQTLAIVDQLISGGQVLELDEDTHEEHASEFLVRQLDQVPVPKYYVGLSFEQLFIGMLKDHNALAMGLYRTLQKNDGMSFVYTNPIPTEEIQENDLIYVLH